jgi:flagellar assembly protein FliH
MSALLKPADVQAQGLVIRPFVEAPAAAAAAPPEPSPPSLAGDERHLRLLERIAEEMVRDRAQLLAELRPDLLELACSIAREIIGHEVIADRAIIEQTLAQALQNLHFATRLVVRLHPDDLAHLQEQQAAWSDHSARLDFVADPEIEAGGCRVNSDRGGFDATLQTQLSTLRAALAASYHG